MALPTLQNLCCSGIAESSPNTVLFKRSFSGSPYVAEPLLQWHSRIFAQYCTLQALLQWLCRGCGTFALSVAVHGLQDLCFFSGSPDTIPGGWLGSKRRLTPSVALQMLRDLWPWLCIGLRTIAPLVALHRLQNICSCSGSAYSAELSPSTVLFQSLFSGTVYAAEPLLLQWH